MSSDIYAIDQIEMKDVSAEGAKTIVSYQALMESLYFSPGVRVQAQGDDLVLSAVRCHIDKSCEVDVKAVQDGAVSRVTVPSPKGHIYWADRDGKKAIEVTP